MENFVVSARKYRPASFDTVVGQGSITATLKNAIKNNQLAQAYLFCGPRGVGKTTCSRIFAKTINCLNLTENLEACNECESCRAFNENRSYNIHELDAASNNSVDDIRMLIDKVRIPPQIGKYSVYIVDEVHMLSPAAFNAFLKTLEEPPAHAKFILATTEKHKILPTILSRCQIFDFNRMSVEGIVGHLQNLAQKEGIDADIDGLNVIAQKADGGMRDALSLFDQIVSFAGKKFTYQDVINNLNVLDYEYYFKLTDMFLAGDIAGSLLTFNEILSKGFDAHHFISGLSQHFRDLMVCRDANTLQLLEVGAGIRDHYKKQSESLSVPFIYTALNITNRCDLDYRESKSKRLLVELTLMQLCNINNQITGAIQSQPTTSNATVQQPNVQQQTPVATQQIQPSQQNSTPSQAQIAEQNVKKTAEISIKDYIQNKNIVSKQENEQKKQTEQTVANQPTATENENFTLEQLQKIFASLAEIYRTKKPRLHAIFKECMPQLKDNFVVEITLQNSLQEDAINEVKSGFVNYLRKQLHNTSIDVVTKISNIQPQNAVYTDADKYKFLSQQNANLEVLKQNLNLDF